MAATAAAATAGTPTARRGRWRRRQRSGRSLGMVYATGGLGDGSFNDQARPELSGQQTSLQPGTVTSPANGSTIVSVQGYTFQAHEPEQRSDLLYRLPARGRPHRPPNILRLWYG